MVQLKLHKKDWVLPKHDSCIAPENVWSNKGACWDRGEERQR